MPFWKRKKPEAKAVAEAKKDPMWSSYDLEPISQEISDARSSLINNRSFQRAAPRAKGVAMDSACGTGAPAMGGYGNVNQVALSYYAAANSFIGYQAMAIIAQNWFVTKACSMFVRDAVKKWYEISVNDETGMTAEQIKQIEKWDKDYKLKKNMIEGETFNGFFGIRHILFKHTNPSFDYSKPFNPDSWSYGEYAGMSQIDPYWITPEFEGDDLTDPTRIGYYDPTYWYVDGRRYHKSHFVILYGDEVADYLKPTYWYGGISKTQKLYERLYASERTANEAPQLTMTKRIIYRTMDLVKAQANKLGLMKAMQAQTEYMNNYSQVAVGTNEAIGTLETSLTDLNEVIMGQYGLSCAIMGVPITKMMGTSSNGFGTGETDEDYYISSVEELQGNACSWIAQAHYARLVPTLIKPKFGVEPEIELSWNKIKVMSEKEQAEVNLINSQSDALQVGIGSVDNIDVAKRLIADANSGYTGMELPMQQDPEDDFGDGLGDPDGES